MGRIMTNPKQSSSSYVRAYGKVQKIEPYRLVWLSKIVYSGTFELLISVVIVINAISLAVLTMPNLDPEVIAAANTIDGIAFVIYAFELVMRILSYGKKPWMFFREGWNVFDFIVVGLSPFFQGQTAVIRLLRLLRLVRIFRFLPEVRILSASIVKSIPPLMSMTVLISLLLFLYGMAGFYIFGEQAPESWGNIGLSMKSLFILLTLENFPVYLEEAMLITPIAIPFFLSYVFLIVFTVLNVLIGIVLNAMDEAREEDRTQREQLKNLKGLSADVSELSSSDKNVKLEIQRLRDELSKLESTITSKDQSPKPKA
jgi:voltage-gated sodium channel